MGFNPYKYLSNVARTQFHVEGQLSIEDRRNTNWMHYVDVFGTTILIGRGGANTCFIQVGGGKRKFGFPNQILSLLDRLAKQDYILYKVEQDGDIQTFVSSVRALKEEPRERDKIFGVNEDGKSDLLYKAQSDLFDGALSWVPVHKLAAGKRFKKRRE